jgi:hypothetical protein
MVAIQANYGLLCEGATGMSFNPFNSDRQWKEKIFFVLI